VTVTLSRRLVTPCCCDCHRQPNVKTLLVGRWLFDPPPTRRSVIRGIPAQPLLLRGVSNHFWRRSCSAQTAPSFRRSYSAAETQPLHWRHTPFPSSCGREPATSVSDHARLAFGCVFCIFLATRNLAARKRLDTHSETHCRASKISARTSARCCSRNPAPPVTPTPTSCVCYELGNGVMRVLERAYPAQSLR